MIWQDIKGYENMYQINELGQVKSLSREKKDTIGGVIKERILKPIKMKTGYTTYGLSKDGKVHRVYAHQLMREHFLDGIRSKRRTTTNHLDGNKENNALVNLEVCSYSENIQHAYDTGLRTKGLSVNMKESIRLMRLSGMSVVFISELTGIKKHSVYRHTKP